MLKPHPSALAHPAHQAHPSQQAAPAALSAVATGANKVLPTPAAGGGTCTRAAAQGQADDWLRLDHQLCFALYASSLAMTKAYKPLLAPLGLTYPQYLVMLALWETDGVTVNALGERLALDSGTLTPLLKRLESQGLLQRLRDAADERRVRLHLSPAGRSLRAQAAAVPRAMASAMACPLDELQQLTQRLGVLRQNLLGQNQLHQNLLAAPPPDAA